MRKLIKYTLLCSLSFFTLLSCIEDQDFNQFDDIFVNPLLEASIFYVETPESLVDASVAGGNVVGQNFNFDAFSSKVFADRVIDGTITYIVENTTNNELSVTIELLDVDGNVLDTTVVPVFPAPMEMQQIDVFYGDSDRSIDIIKNTSGIRVEATNLSDDTSATNGSDPKIILKSSGKFRVEVIV
ncbi:hypothetical protein N9Y48_01775 [Zobellia sp.]|nr:hypothetical protein [Zobellia sp.]